MKRSDDQFKVVFRFSGARYLLIITNVLSQIELNGPCL